MRFSRTLQRERMFAWLCASFGALALALCVEGMRLMIAGLVLGVPPTLYCAHIAERIQLLPEGSFPMAYPGGPRFVGRSMQALRRG